MAFVSCKLPPRSLKSCFRRILPEHRVSATTRPKRPGEVAGRDYHFVEKTDFDLMINRGEFLEYANSFDDVWWATREEIADWYLENHESHIPTGSS